jgi:YggT family protein
MSTVLGLVAAAITVVQLVLLARVASSWVLVLAGPGGRHPGVVRVDTALARLTEPILAPVRRVIPPLRLGSVALDLSIPVVLLALSLVTLLLPGA